MSIDNRTDAERRYDAERDGSLYVKPEPTALGADEEAVLKLLIALSPPDPDELVDAVRIERGTCEDTGQEVATRFFAGEGDAAVEIWVPDSGVVQEAPRLFMLGREGMEIDVVAAIVPHLQTLLADPRMHAARAAWGRVGFIPYRPEPGDEPTRVIALLEDIESHFAARPSTFDQSDRTIISAILAVAPPDDDDLPAEQARRAANRHERWLRLLDQVADLDEAEQSEALGFMQGVIVGIRIGRRAE